MLVHNTLLQICWIRNILRTHAWISDAWKINHYFYEFQNENRLNISATIETFESVHWKRVKISWENDSHGILGFQWLFTSFNGFLQNLNQLEIMWYYDGRFRKLFQKFMVQYLLLDSYFGQGSNKSWMNNNSLYIIQLLTLAYCSLLVYLRVYSRLLITRLSICNKNGK